MTKSATRVAADKVTFTQTEVTSAVALKAPIASPVFTGNVLIGGTTVASSAGGLNVETTSSGNVTSTIVMQNQATGNNSGVNLAFRGQRNSGAQADYTYIQSVADDTAAGNGSIRFHTALGGTIAERMKLDSAGDLTISGGVYLGGTGAANKLDDYESGFFTATLTGSTTAPNTAMTISAIYTKVGNLVTVQGKFTSKDSTGVSGSIYISGLPFTSYNSNDTNGVGSVWHSRASTSDMHLYLSPNTTQAAIDNAAGNGITWASTGTGTYCGFSLTYRVA